MLEASVPSRFFSTSLPDQRIESGCFALLGGLGEHAAAFPFEALFGVNALLGPAIPESDEEAASLFDVSVPVYLCDEVTSTFAVAHDLARKDLLPVWGAALAACQTAGRGQLRRHWQSPRGNLYVTFRLPDTPLFHSSAAALATGVLLAMALCRLGYPVRLKWPNDLLNSSQEKVAGLLLEERGDVVLAGLGVNLRVLPDAQRLRREHAAPAGLLQDAGGNPSILSPFGFWRLLADEMIRAYSAAFASATSEILPSLADPFLAWKGEAVTVSDVDGSVTSGWMEGVGPAGGLSLLTADGKSHELFRGSLAQA